jgi:hypothetical protein
VDATIRIEPADCAHQSHVPFAKQGLRWLMTSVVDDCNVDNKMAVTFNQELSRLNVMMVAPAMTQRVISIDGQLSGGRALVACDLPCRNLLASKRTGIIGRNYQYDRAEQEAIERWYRRPRLGL